MVTIMHDKTHLPTVAEIEAPADVLSVRTNTIKVVRAENMKFVAANSGVPVPKVHDHFVDHETGKRYIIMDYVPGTDLEKLLLSLTLVEKKTVRYFGNLTHKPYADGVLSSPHNNPMISGPFQNQEEMNQAILRKIGQSQSPHYIRLLQGMVDRTLKGHRIVFTHRDLQPKNIMVERCGLREDGSNDFEYPEFWDSCNSILYCQLKPNWLELVPDILDQYPLEYLMMRVVYASVFY
ncbi:hypothetical protein BO94DRAFT_565234 [Aspergillus sclerotioniger CBS 115572]|uniref:Aminoglycoside phosphotransferase domain-containing protein n=1 Tax=Aspergillus sclerotioniger CBS 115572 TaxID=1450535 RepID=A0A317WSU4_9EURO|nr:hypothetical protein BO94DRAFT_565234 [Aspergillus sclerotioniger CBS 115572]PWY89409.1 hypothetical protein BO94DRAFT_565234 [Aspergillus sclerotioniger CBS 115572]